MIATKDTYQCPGMEKPVCSYTRLYCSVPCYAMLQYYNMAMSTAKV